MRRASASIAETSSCSRNLASQGIGMSRPLRPQSFVVCLDSRRRRRASAAQECRRKRAPRGRIAMSGPKAFRIVTRAEIIAICRRDLARLDAAIESWTSAGRRNETIEQKDIDKVIARRDELRRLLNADRFIELQKQVAAEVAFLQADSERRVEKAAEIAIR